MNALDTLALNNALETKVAKAARDAVEAGSFNVDVTVRITGSINVAEDTEKTPTVSIPVKEVLALFIARSGCTREASLKLLRECLTDALAESPVGVGAIDGAVDLDAEFKAMVAGLTSSLPKTPVKGKVTTKLTVVEVQTGINVAAK